MDFKVMNKAISTNETLFDDFDERPVDCDFVLPDYCCSGAEMYPQAGHSVKAAQRGSDAGGRAGKHPGHVSG